MDFYGDISVIGSFASVVGMAVSIWQAYRARHSRLEAQKALKKILYHAAGERLEVAQEHILNIAPERLQKKALGRGINTDDVIQKLRSEFDRALSAMPKQGNVGEARDMLSQAQKSLDAYVDSWRRMKNVNVTDQSIEKWNELRVYVQDARSFLNSNAIDETTNDK